MDNFFLPPAECPALRAYLVANERHQLAVRLYVSLSGPWIAGIHGEASASGATPDEALRNLDALYATDGVGR